MNTPSYNVLLNKEKLIHTVQDLCEEANKTSTSVNDEQQRAEGVEGDLNTRLETVEELATISVSGGDIGIATAADFDNPDAEARAKVPTVGAIYDSIDDFAVYDISAHNGGATYADLAAALGTNGTNVPSSIRKGGMSIKFVRSSDNKYVQYRLISSTWSINTEDWAITDEGVYVENPEFVYVKTDAEDKILWAIKVDGDIFYGAGVPSQVVNYINDKIAELSLDEYEDIVSFLSDYLGSDTTLKVMIDWINTTIENKLDKDGLDPDALNSVQAVENPEFMKVELDADDKVLGGRKVDGTKFENNDVELNGNVTVDGSLEVDGFVIENTEDPEGRLEISTDSEKKIIKYRKDDGTLVENVGIVTPKIVLFDSGLTDLQQALRRTGFGSGVVGDLSNSDHIELPEPKHYGLMNLMIDFIPRNANDVAKGYAEYYDNYGNYFKISCDIATQGQSSQFFASTGGKSNFTLDVDRDVKFGEWVPQDSFHLKGCAKDVTRGFLSTSYKWAYKFMQALDAKPNRCLKKSDANTTTTSASGDSFTDWPDDARCLADGFPIELYINGVYYGLYALQLKKHRKNYSMKKSDYTSFFIDADNLMPDGLQTGFWLGDIPWTLFEIKNPKDLYCMDGSKYDGDHPKELIDNTSQYYNADNAKHVGSAQTKSIIEGFSTKYLAVKALIDNNELADAKDLFASYFDVNACMLVYIFNCLMRNGDSVSKNTLWGTWKNGRIAPMLWDLDGAYGEGWIGNSASVPSAYLWDGIYATSAWPLAEFWTLYETEIKTKYAELRDNGIISINTWHEIVFKQWAERIGTEAYTRDRERWPETPSYRKNYTNTEYWTENSILSSLGSVPLWDSETTYSQGNEVAIKLHNGVNYWMKYTAVQANTNICPVSKFYEGFPIVGGYYNSPYRMERWMTEQIALCDIKLGYTPQQ